MTLAVEGNPRSQADARAAGQAPATLLELCDPLFDYICRLNRSARKGGTHDLSTVRADIKNLLASLKQRSALRPGLGDQFDKIELPLLFFIDFMIKESPLYFAREWKELAFERGELAGDEKFFDLLDEELKDRSEAATERLTIYYTAVGLGFTGWYTGQPEYLRKKMMEISARVRGAMDTGPDARICPEAYEHVDTRDLIEPPGTKLLGIVIAMIGLLVVLFVANGYLYKTYSSEISDSIKWLVDHPGKATPPASPAP